MFRLREKSGLSRQGAKAAKKNLFVFFALLAALRAIVLPAANAQTITFSEQIAPIVYNNCSKCHRPGKVAPFSLLSYDDVNRHAAQIAAVTKRRFMPPWLPEPGYGDFADAKRLTDAQIETLARWAKSGTLEGAAADLPPAPHFV